MTSTIDEQFTNALNAAFNLYHEERLVECQKAASDLLANSAIPRYHRMKVLILLASILGDWEEANECRVDAWALYNIVRRWHPVGNDSTADESLDEILVQLREVDSALEEDEDAPKWTLGEEQESVEIVDPNAEDDIEATRQELEVLNMAEDDIEVTEEELEVSNMAGLDVVKPTRAAALTLPVTAKPREVSVRDKASSRCSLLTCHQRNRKFLSFDLAASCAEPKEAADLPPEPGTSFWSIAFADAAMSVPPGGT